MSFEIEILAARTALPRADARLGAFMEEVGPCALRRVTRFSPFEVLSSSIAHQQLTGKAAQTILGRYKQRLGDGKWPTPERVRGARTSTLRACGFSTSKALSLKDLAEKSLDGTIPSAAKLHRMPEEEIIARLTEVRGVGRWTVEMMLMFTLGRIDVLPIDDYGVRKGYAKLYGHSNAPKPKELAALGDVWRPYRSIASWYLWRAAERLK